MNYLDVDFAKRGSRLPRITLGYVTRSTTRLLAVVFAAAFVVVVVYGYVIVRVEKHTLAQLLDQENTMQQRYAQHRPDEQRVSAEIAELNKAYAAREVNGQLARRLSALFHTMNPGLGVQTLTIDMTSGTPVLSFAADAKSQAAGDQLYAALNNASDFADSVDHGIHSFTIGARPTSQ